MARQTFDTFPGNYGTTEMQTSCLTALQLFFCPEYSREVSRNILQRLKPRSVSKFPDCPFLQENFVAAPIITTSVFLNVYINKYMKD
jgi:hypothetical protein